MNDSTEKRIQNNGRSSSASIASTRHREMLNMPIPRLIMKMALPTIIIQLISVIYNTADTYFVAGIHTSAAAAVGIVYSLMALIHALGFGIGMGAGSIISRKLGEKDNAAACQYSSSAFVAAFLMGSVILILGECFLNPLLRILGSTDTILTYARDYTKYILLGAPIMCSMFVLNIILRSEGEAAFSMYGVGAGGLLNALLDPLFIFKFGWGISGAAIATIVSQCVSFLILLSFFLRGRSIVNLSFHQISLKPRIYWLIFSSGFPTICRQGLGSISSALLNILASGYGDAVVAALTIANKIYILVRSTVIGIGQGMQPVAGYNFGAGDFLRVRKAFCFASLLGTIVCIAASLLLFPFATEVISQFRPDADVVRLGRIAILMGCASIPTMAYSTYTNQLSQCLGFRLGATLLASCRQGFFYIPAALILPYFMREYGLAAVQPVADMCTFAVSVFYQIRFFRKNLPLKTNL